MSSTPHVEAATALLVVLACVPALVIAARRAVVAFQHKEWGGTLSAKRLYKSRCWVAFTVAAVVFADLMLGMASWAHDVDNKTLEGFLFNLFRFVSVPGTLILYVISSCCSTWHFLVDGGSEAAGLALLAVLGLPAFAYAATYATVWISLFIL